MEYHSIRRKEIERMISEIIIFRLIIARRIFEKKIPGGFLKNIQFFMVCYFT